MTNVDFYFLTVKDFTPWDDLIASQVRYILLKVFSTDFLDVLFYHLPSMISQISYTGFSIFSIIQYSPL